MSPSCVQKSVKKSNLLINSIVNNRSLLTILREGIYLQIPPSPFTGASVQLSGCGNSNIQLKTSFRAEIQIDNNIFSSTVYVVNSSLMSMQFIFGSDVIFWDTLSGDENGVKLTETPPNVILYTA